MKAPHDLHASMVSTAVPAAALAVMTALDGAAFFAAFAFVAAVFGAAVALRLAGIFVR